MKTIFDANGNPISYVTDDDTILDAQGDYAGHFSNGDLFDSNGDRAGSYDHDGFTYDATTGDQTGWFDGTSHYDNTGDRDSSLY